MTPLSVAILFSLLAAPTGSPGRAEPPVTATSPSTAAPLRVPAEPRFPSTASAPRAAGHGGSLREMRTDEAFAGQVAAALAAARIVEEPDGFGPALALPKSLAQLTRDSRFAFSFVVEWRQDDRRMVLGNCTSSGGNFAEGRAAPMGFDPTRPFRVALVPTPHLPLATSTLRAGEKPAPILGCGFELEFATKDATPSVSIHCSGDAACALEAVVGEAAGEAARAIARTMRVGIVKVQHSAEYAEETLRISGAPETGDIGLSGRMSVASTDLPGFGGADVAGIAPGSLYDGGVLELSLPQTRHALRDILLKYEPDIEVAGTRNPTQRRFIATPFFLEISHTDGSVRVFAAQE